MSSNYRRTATALLAAAALGAPAFAQSPAARLEQSTAAGTQRAASTARTARAGTAAPGTTVVRAAPELKPCTAVTVDPPTHLTLGKSRVVRLDFPAARIVVGGQSAARVGAPEPVPQAGAPGMPARAPTQTAASDGVADTQITLLSPTELFFLGRKTGSMNVVLQGADGRCVVKDITVTVDPETLQAKLVELMPEQTGIKVRGAESSLVLTGSVTDLVKLDQVLTLANSYSDPKRVVNLLSISAPQQVMLEVKIAEVSKTLLDRFGLDFSRMVVSADGLKTSILSGLVGGVPGLFGRFQNVLPANAIGGQATGSVAGGNAAAAATAGSTQTTMIQNPDGTFSTRTTLTPGTISKSSSLLGVDAKKQDGIIRVLAEPNIMAISGQSASFLSGGKIFIPVAQDRTGGGTTITLEEKEFGVGLKFTPTVLDGRINLKLVSEVSELSQTGTPFTTVAGVTAVLPSMATRRVDTTVQLGDGQSFVVAGLIKNNMNTALSKFPGLGEVPVMGALFRSTEFQTDQTELMFVVTPRLIKPVTTAVTLPTDNHVPPSRADIIFMGSGEGRNPAPVRAAAQPTPPPPYASAPAAQPTPAVTLPADNQPAQTRADAMPMAAGEAAAPAPVRESIIEATPIAAPAPAPAATVIDPTSAVDVIPPALPAMAPASAAEIAPVASTAPTAAAAQ